MPSGAGTRDRRAQRLGGGQSFAGFLSGPFIGGALERFPRLGDASVGFRLVRVLEGTASSARTVQRSGWTSATPPATNTRRSTAPSHQIDMTPGRTVEIIGA